MLEPNSGMATSVEVVVLQGVAPRVQQETMEASSTGGGSGAPVATEQVWVAVVAVEAVEWVVVVEVMVAKLMVVVAVMVEVVIAYAATTALAVVAFWGVGKADGVSGMGVAMVALDAVAAAILVKGVQVVKLAMVVAAVSQMQSGTILYHIWSTAAVGHLVLSCHHSPFQ